MNALLTDIELDVQELKCVIEAISRDSNKALCDVAKRNILQMRTRLDLLLKELEHLPLVEKTEKIDSEESVISVTLVERGEKNSKQVVISKEESAATTDLKLGAAISRGGLINREESVVMTSADVIKENEEIQSVSDLRRLLSLNDSFRFSRELFGNNSERLNHVLRQLSEMNSLDAALAFLDAETQVDAENEALLDLQEILRAFFDK